MPNFIGIDAQKDCARISSASGFGVKKKKNANKIVRISGVCILETTGDFLVVKFCL